MTSEERRLLVLESKVEGLIQGTIALTTQVMKDIAELRNRLAELQGIGLEEYLTNMQLRVTKLEIWTAIPNEKSTGEDT